MASLGWERERSLRAWNASMEEVRKKIGTIKEDHMFPFSPNHGHLLPLGQPPGPQLPCLLLSLAETICSGQP